MKARDVARREAFEQCRGGDEEEIRAHRVPVELAHARDRRGETAARRDKLEGIAAPDAEALGDPMPPRDRPARAARGAGPPARGGGALRPLSRRATDRGLPPA